MFDYGRRLEFGISIIPEAASVAQARALAAIERIRIFPDVANLPLRPPATLAKQAASLDLLSRGRFELGLGAMVGRIRPVASVTQSRETIW